MEGKRRKEKIVPRCWRIIYHLKRFAFVDQTEELSFPAP